MRRQMLRDYRTPLIVMTPKSLLRRPMAVNTLADLTERGFINVWCQEEPLNQGAWLSIQPSLRLVLGGLARLDVASRPASASPAVGSPKVHAKQQQELVNSALGIVMS